VGQFDGNLDFRKDKRGQWHMGTVERNISERLADAVISVLGIVLAFMPLALWVA
jgi:hypothetical protein